MYKNMYGKYSLNKTLRFSLIPQGNTMNTIKSEQIIEEAKKKTGAYNVLKPLIDDFYNEYINKLLSKFRFKSDELKILRLMNDNNDINQKKKTISELKKSIINFIKHDNEKESVFKNDLLKDGGMFESLILNINFYYCRCGKLTHDNIV